LGKRFESEGWHREGHPFPIEISSIPVKASRGNLFSVFIRDITERKLAEAEEGRLWTILDASLNEIYMFRLDTLRFTYVSRGALSNIGYTLEAMQAMTPLDIKPEMTESSFRELIAPILTGEQQQIVFQTVHRRKDESLYPVEVHLQVVGQGLDRTFLALIYDITARVEQEHRQAAEHAIAQILLDSDSLEEAAQEILETVCRALDWKVGVLWKVDEEMQVLRYVGEWKTSLTQAETFLERTRRSDFARGIGLPGRVWESGKVEWVSDVTRDSNFPRASFAEADGLYSAFAFPIKVEGNVQAVMEFFSDAVRPPDQPLLNLFAVVATEISWFLARQLIEQQLRVSEARYSGILQLANDAIVTVNDSQRIVLFNQGAERVFGYAAEEVLGQPLSLLMPDRFQGGHHRHVRAFASDASIARPMNARNEITGRRKNGEEFPAEASIARVAVAGQTTYTAILRDISQRKQEAQSLRDAKASAEQAASQKEALLAAVEAFFIEVSETGAVCQWTSQAEKIFDIPLSEAMGRTFQDLSIGWSREAIQEAISRATKTRRSVYLDKVLLVTHENRQRFLKLTITPLCKDSGVAVVVMGEDITAHLLLEHDLAQAQKLESIGHLAAGIAHEINTPTQFVGDNVRFLLDSFADLHTVLDRYRELLASAKTGACATDLIEACELELQRADLDYLQIEIPKALTQSAEGVERIATIVRAMKDFAHPGSEEKVSVDLNKAIKSTVEVSRNEWKYVADLTTDLAPDLPPVPCLQGPFNQVILNLIVNAAHAIGDRIKSTGQKGIISIMSRRVDDWDEIRITDNGSGIPEHIRHKIFDPFFTTKEVGKGTGQGLAIARSVVVDKHRGTITVESQVGQGTTFIVRLPLNGSGETGEMEQAA
jgi:PAS domain S-box-containing protein